MILKSDTAENTTDSLNRDRPLIITFWLMLIIAVWCWSLSWNSPILDRHEFRQLQTAVSAHWLKQDGFRLNYETPLFGPPTWSIPMEFPVYQWCVAKFSRFTSLALDQSGRAISIFFLLATLPAVCGLASVAGLKRSGQLLVAAAVLSSPVYLFYGRAFMIETTGLCFATWFLLATGLAVRDLNVRWSVVATISGTLAALTKITTLAVYCFPAAGLVAWLGWPHWKNRATRSITPVWRAVLLGSLPVFLAVAVGEWWVRHADAVKDANPFSGFLKSSEMTAWNWGTLDQRFSLTVWSEVWSNIRQFVLGEPATAVLLICAALAAGPLRRFAAGSAVAFIVGPLLFANLYFRHDYYYSANALLLLGAAGLLLAGMWESFSLPRSAKLLILALFFGAQLLTFHRGYAYNHRRELPQPPEIASVIRKAVPADGVVLIYGWDWDSRIPYYSQHRAIMVPGGREMELKVLEDILVQLPPLRIAALLIRQPSPGAFSPEFIEERIKRFNLAPTPFATSADGNLYLPETKIDAASSTLAQNTAAPPRTGEPTVGQLQEDDPALLNFHAISPAPVKARSQFGLKTGEVNGQRVVFSHPVSELYFNPPGAAAQIDARFGVMDAAYDPKGSVITDGVTFEIYELSSDGRRRDLYQRHLDPAQVPDDRGLQAITLRNFGSLTGQVVFKTSPGLKNNLANDWAYWSQITIN